MSTATRQFIEKLSQAKNNGVYAEECASMISDWYRQVEPAAGISLADMAYIVGSDEKAAALRASAGAVLSECGACRADARYRKNQDSRRDPE